MSLRFPKPDSADEKNFSPITASPFGARTIWPQGLSCAATLPRWIVPPSVAMPVITDHRIALSLPHAPKPAELHAQMWSPDTPASQPLAPIVLLHESLGCAAMWRGFPAALCAATGRAVVAYDRWGFGQSSERTGAMELDFVAREAAHAFAAVRAHLGIGPFVALGHSVGGGMAVHCAAQYPEACVALITEAAQTFVEPRTLTGIRAAQAVFSRPESFARLAKYHGEKTRWVFDTWVNTWLSPAFADWRLDPALPQVRCPTLALHGELDEYGSLEHPQRIARLVQGPARYMPLPGLRHIPHLEAMQPVTAAIAEFLQPLP